MTGLSVLFHVLWREIVMVGVGERGNVLRKLSHVLLHLLLEHLLLNLLLHGLADQPSQTHRRELPPHRKQPVQLRCKEWQPLF